MTSLIACIYFKGGSDNDHIDYADIMEYSDSEVEEKWTKVGEMSQSRAASGVSIVNFDEYKTYCQ